MKRTDRQRILDLAAGQHGVFTLGQAIESGLTAAAVDNWAASGELLRLDRGTWAVSGAPSSPERIAMAAVLRAGSGAALARSSAAWLWELPRHSLSPVRVMRARGDRPTNTCRAHSSRLFTDQDVTRRRGIPVTTPTRTLFDLAGHQHPQRTRKDLNDLTSRGLVNLDVLNEALDRLSGKGRPGIRTMRSLIRELEEKGAPTGSSLELMAEGLLAEAGFVGLVRQFPVYDERGFIARVDFGDPIRRIAFEVDSDRFHLGLVDRMLDEEKAARLVTIGWSVVRITEREVWFDRPSLTRRLRSIRRASASRDVA
jgi:very-short-patch-repair endonuclease